MAGESGPAASTVLPSYPVGRGIFLPSDQLLSGQLLPPCEKCGCRALIARVSNSNSFKNGVLCLDHGLEEDSITRCLVVRAVAQTKKKSVVYRFISPEHEAAIRAFLA